MTIDTSKEAVGCISDYDCGLINDFGGGNIDWWQDYLRAEIGRANDYWRNGIHLLVHALSSDLEAMRAERDAALEVVALAGVYIKDLEAHEGAEAFSRSTWVLESAYLASLAKVTKP